MKPENEKKLLDTCKHLADAQTEVLEAMEARKGEIGEQYSSIVAEAAASIATLRYLANGEEGNEFAPYINHAIECVTTFAAVRLGELLGQDLQKNKDEALVNELIMDIASLVQQSTTTVRITGEHDEGEDE